MWARLLSTGHTNIVWFQQKQRAGRVRGELCLCSFWVSIQSRFIADQGQPKSMIWVACELKYAEIQCLGTNFHINAVWLDGLHVSVV